MKNGRDYYDWNLPESDINSLYFGSDQKYIGRQPNNKRPVPLTRVYKMAMPIFTTKSWGTKGYK